MFALTSKTERQKRKGSKGPAEALDGRLVALIFALTGIFGGFAIFLTDAAGPVSRVDSTADWLLATAFVEGRDPYEDLRTLADEYEVTFWEGEDAIDRVAKHPRAPGALVVLAPLALGNPELASSIMLGLGLLATAATFVLLTWRFPLPVAVLLLGMAAALLSGPARWHYLFVTQSPVVMFLVAVVVVTASRGDYVTTGVALAIAGSLKAFPLVLVLLLIQQRRKRATVAAISGFVLLNLMPLIAPHVAFDSMVSALTETAGSWVDLTIGIPGMMAQFSQPGLIAVVGIALGLVSIPAILLFLGRVSPPMGAVGVLAASLLALPVSWPHYLLVLIPVFILTLDSWRVRSSAGVLMLAGAALLVPMVPIWSHTAGLALIWIGVAIQGAQHNRSFSSAHRPATIV